MANATVISKTAAPGETLSMEQAAAVITEACPAKDYRGKRVLLIVPDGTRTAPVGAVFRTLHRQIGAVTKALDVLIALGTHQPMNDAAICRRLDISETERRADYRQVQFFNHAWDNPAALNKIGVIPADEIQQLTGGLFGMDVPVEINRRIFDYDQVILVGPVFPHEVVGFSGGNKYLFPGVAGPEILNFFHWLAAVITNPKIIGTKWTPVRKVIDRAGGMVPVPQLCFCLVGRGEGLSGLFAGSPEAAWDHAANLSHDVHIVYHDKPFAKILSCAPSMYADLWTGGKAMYKLEPCSPTAANSSSTHRISP
jgi:nickel-dependent lactate racemase